MIESKSDLNEYLLCDAKNYMEVSGNAGFLNWVKSRLSSTPIGDQRMIWKYIVALRKSEYYMNRGGVKSPLTLLWFHKLRKLSRIVGYQIPPNTIGKGLTIWHWGTIVINPYAKLGDNCVLQPGITIGHKEPGEGNPQIGSDVTIGSGARIIGDITIGDDVVIGPNTVVVKDIPSHSVVVGVPGIIIKTRKDKNSKWERIEER